MTGDWQTPATPYTSQTTHPSSVQGTWSEQVTVYYPSKVTSYCVNFNLLASLVIRFIVVGFSFSYLPVYWQFLVSRRTFITIMLFTIAEWSSACSRMMCWSLFIAWTWVTCFIWAEVTFATS